MAKRLVFWIYDQGSLKGNRLCLYGTSPFTTCALMSSFPDGTGNWAFKADSFYTGNENGYFNDGEIDCPGAGWATYTQYLTGCATAAYAVCFTN